MLAALLAALAAALSFAATARPQDPVASGATVAFRNRAGSFRIDVPAGWRQLAPGERKALERAVPVLPHDVLQNVPDLFYAVGPVDRWLEGKFDGEYLYVVEQDAEWTLDGDLKARLQQMWDTKGTSDGQRYEVLSAEKTTLGLEAHPVVLVERRIHPARGEPLRSLDLHVPTGGREVTLCFVVRDAAFDAQKQSLLARAASLALARKSRGETKLSDRLWTPILAGAAVGLVLLILYKRTRRPPA